MPILKKHSVHFTQTQLLYVHASDPHWMLQLAMTVTQAMAALTLATIINMLRRLSLMLRHAAAQQRPQLLYLRRQLFILHIQILHQTAIHCNIKTSHRIHGSVCSIQVNE